MAEEKGSLDQRQRGREKGGKGSVSGEGKSRRPNLETHQQCQINFQHRGIKEVWASNSGS